jgi:hypothetical protein
MGKEKFTRQFSDQLPLWMQIDTDIDGQLTPSPRFAPSAFTELRVRSPWLGSIRT